MKQLQRFFHHAARYEWLLFYGLVIINIVPVWSSPFFPSVDGPAHLHNANLICRLLSGHQALLPEFYAFNHEIVPNWGGHFVLVCLYFLFSPAVAVRLLVALFLFFLPLSFRYCLRSINGRATFVSYLIFPFTYTFMFCMGFYNFYFGLIVLFTAIGRIMVYRREPIRAWPVFILFMLILLSYLGHLFVFLSLCMLMGFVFSMDVIQALCRKEQVKDSLRKALALLVVSALPLVLTVRYFTHSQGQGQGHKVYLLKTQLLQWITNCRSIVWYTMENESRYTTFVFLVVVVLFSIALYMRTTVPAPTGAEGHSPVRAFLLRFKAGDVFLLLLLVFLYLYFRLPDEDRSAGFISSRLNLMVFLFALLWISGFTYPRWMEVVSVIVVLFSQARLMNVRGEVFAQLNEGIVEMMVLEKEIKPNTIILPVNYEGNWLTGHNANYLGISKPVVILENYECNNTYFPLTWHCDKTMLALTHSDWSKADRIIRETPLSVLNRVNYIVVQGKNALPDSVKNIIMEQYSIQKETEHLLLFERK